MSHRIVNGRKPFASSLSRWFLRPKVLSVLQLLLLLYTNNGDAFVLLSSLPLQSFPKHVVRGITTIGVSSGSGCGVIHSNDTLKEPFGSGGGSLPTKRSATSVDSLSISPANRYSDVSPTTPTPTPTTTMIRNGDSTKSSVAAATTTTATRGYCPRCKRPEVVCLCRALPESKIDCGTKVLILQHPREAKKRKRTSTVPLISLCLENVSVCKGTIFGEGSHPLLDEALARNDYHDESGDGCTIHHAVLLYPSERAVPLRTFLESKEKTQITAQPAVTEPSEMQTNPGLAKNNNSNSNNNNNSNILVVLDGTWAQTQTMVKNSESVLARLPAVMFDEPTNSVFDRLRREPAKHCTSTLEAVAKAIRLLPGPEQQHHKKNQSPKDASLALEKTLEVMVEQQLGFALDERTSRPRYYRNDNDDKLHETKSTHQDRNFDTGRSARKSISRRRTAALSLPRVKTKEEIELERIRFVYVAHMG